MTGKRVLITGAAGFLGRYICTYLVGLSEGLNLICTDVIKRNDTCCNKFIVADMSNAEAVKGLIEQAKPDYIIHLAGTFGTGDNQEIYKVNVLSMAVLLEAVRQYTPHAVVIATGSAAEYGRIAENELPVEENYPCRPVTPYGLSKLLATQIAMYYCRVHNISVMIVRPFQLIGKGVTPRLAPGAFAEQLKQAIAKDLNIIKVGNLEGLRDFLDVHDAIEAIWALCQKPAPGQIFNLCSGKPTKIADLLVMMIDISGANVRIEVDPTRLSSGIDVSKVYGSYQKIKGYCGWQPKRNLAQSIQAIFE